MAAAGGNSCVLLTPTSATAALVGGPDAGATRIEQCDPPVCDFSSRTDGGSGRHQPVHRIPGVASVDRGRRQPALAAQAEHRAGRIHDGPTLWYWLGDGLLAGACH